MIEEYPRATYRNVNIGDLLVRRWSRHINEFAIVISFTNAEMQTLYYRKDLIFAPYPTYFHTCDPNCWRKICEI